MKVHDLGWWLLVVVGLNLGLASLGRLMGNASWNVVEMVFASMPGAVNFVYLLTGVAAVWQVINRLNKK